MKTGRYVKSFNNADQFATFLSQSIHKALQRGNRPGWVRTTEFDIEESHAKILQLMDRVHTLEALNADLKVENNRKPDLLITYRRDPACEDEEGHPYGNEPEIKDGVVYFKVKPVYLDDVKDGVTYMDTWGREISVSYNDVRLLRYFFQNGFSLLYHISNSGTARATGVRVHMEIPDGLLIVSNQEIHTYTGRPAINCSEEEYESRMKVLFLWALVIDLGCSVSPVNMLIRDPGDVFVRGFFGVYVVIVGSFVRGVLQCTRKIRELRQECQ